LILNRPQLRHIGGSSPPIRAIVKMVLRLSLQFKFLLPLILISFPETIGVGPGYLGEVPPLAL
jgi:hypothetical protein